MNPHTDFRCPSCGNRFTAQQVYCEDWHDPMRNFGCPHCHTFLQRLTRPRLWREHLAQAHYLAAFMLGVPYLIAHPSLGLQWLVVPAWIVGAVALAFRLDHSLPPRTRLVPVSTVERIVGN